MPVAVALDALALSLVSVASISDRRLYRLLDAKQSNGLPPFLVPESGLNSGFMLIQYTGASLVSRVEVARAPGVGRLDPVERGTGGSRQHGHDRRTARAGRRHERRDRAWRSRRSARRRRSTCARRSQAGPAARAVHDAIRARVPFVEHDREFGPDIEAAVELLRTDALGRGGRERRRPARVTIERSIDLPCPPAEAWAVLTRWERQVDWMLDADEIVVRSEQRRGRRRAARRADPLVPDPGVHRADGGDGLGPAAERSRSPTAVSSAVVARGSSTPVPGGTRFTWSEDVALRVPVLGVAGGGDLRAGDASADGTGAGAAAAADHRRWTGSRHRPLAGRRRQHQQDDRGVGRRVADREVLAGRDR